MKRNKMHKAFTLVEMLVSVAIIAVLLGVLMPSLGSARRQAQAVVCRNNLRSIWTGVRMYAQQYRDRVPVIEPIPPLYPQNLVTDMTNDAYDPFDSDRPYAVGTILGDYVQAGSWVCPAAIYGHPVNAPKGSWTLTYSFRTARMDPDGELVTYDDALESGGPLDVPKYINNYEQFDGRPIGVLDGRRYVASGSPYSNYRMDYDVEQTHHSAYWTDRSPLIRDMLRGPPGRWRYPHRFAELDPRSDLMKAAEQFKRNANAFEATTGFLGLFADGLEVEIMATRLGFPPHARGF